MGILFRKSSSQKIQSWVRCTRESSADSDLSNILISTFSIFWLLKIEKVEILVSPLFQFSPVDCRDDSLYRNPWLLEVITDHALWIKIQVAMKGRASLTCSGTERFYWNQTIGRDDQCWESAIEAQSRRCGNCRCFKWGCHKSYLSGDWLPIGDITY